MVDAPREERSRRRHGFERPWHNFQIASWILYSLVLVHYYAFLHFLLWNTTVQIVMVIVFTVLAVIMGVSVYLTSITDPADIALCQSGGDTAARQTVQDSGDVQHCYQCQVDVHNSSRHCRFCKKCVTRFDHHCKWLNTCIGQRNYQYFLFIVISTAALTTQSLVLSVALTIDSFVAQDSFYSRLNLQRDIGSNLPIEAVQALLLLSVLILAPLVLMVYQLLGFHIMLLYQGITTYDYIILEQRRNREREAEKLRLQCEQQQKQNKKQQERIQCRHVASPEIELDLATAGNSNGHDQQKVRPYQQLETADKIERGEGKGENSSDGASEQNDMPADVQPLGADDPSFNVQYEQLELIQDCNED